MNSKYSQSKLQALYKELPLGDTDFLTSLKEGGLLDTNDYDKIKAQSTETEKVAYFLDYCFDPSTDLHVLLNIIKNTSNKCLVELAKAVYSGM